MKLARASLDWAIKHLVREHDTDLFPLPIEIEAIEAQWSALLPEFEKLDVSSYVWRGGSRFVVPKGPLAFRVATQLEPVDSVVLSALLFEHGPTLEASRLSVSAQRVFSYRFAPNREGRMYAQAQAWHDFWRASRENASKSPNGHVLVADISDFYNQIYHHVLERHFATAGLPDPVIKVLQRYLQTLTDKVSRGVPVGPHSSHIFAECALDALDRTLISNGLAHCRYVDDIHIFAASQPEAVGALYTLTQVLDTQQRLVVQNAKTKIMTSVEFQTLADEMLLDNPINEREKEVLAVIAQQSSGDPYAQVALSVLDADDLAKLDRAILEDLISVYLEQSPVDFQRVAWLVRRLTQVGAPGALELLVDQIPALNPILGTIARYVMAAVPNYKGDCATLGGAILRALDSPIVSRSEYLQSVLMDVIARIPDLNHVDSLTARYAGAAPAVRRSILLAAGGGRRADWLRDRKADFRSMDPAGRRAFIRAAAALPADEAKFWVESVRDSLRPLERVVARQYLPGVKMGEIKISQE
jgi:hypothetical protein